MDKIRLEAYNQIKLKKCEGCGVALIRYKLTVHDKDSEAIQSEFSLCKKCGDNIYKLLYPDADIMPDVIVKQTFTFAHKNK